MLKVRIILSVLACALLLEAAGAQDVSIITRDGLNHILAKPGTELVGARRPDVTVVEYFDYNCPYCKELVPVLQALLAEDPKIAVLYKEWPILGPVSAYAAASALAAGWQGKYLIARRAGVDMDVLQKDRASHGNEIAALLARNDAEAHALTLDGTPGIIVGRQLVPGVADANFFKKLIANSRQGK
jgi:protein-disulfide isomerase